MGKRMQGVKITRERGGEEDVRGEDTRERDGEEDARGEDTRERHTCMQCKEARLQNRLPSEL